MHTLMDLVGARGPDRKVCKFVLTSCLMSAFFLFRKRDDQRVLKSFPDLGHF